MVLEVYVRLTRNLQYIKYNEAPVTGAVLYIRSFGPVFDPSGVRRTSGSYVTRGLGVVDRTLSAFPPRVVPGT